MVWCHILFLRWRCLEYYGEVLDANNGLLIIVELDLRTGRNTSEYAGSNCKFQS